MMSEAPRKKSLMRCLGEFTGFIAKGIKTKVDDTSSCKEVSRTVEETREGNVTLRRTVIEEVEISEPETPKPLTRKDDESCS
jgi:hypothetical protein